MQDRIEAEAAQIPAAEKEFLAAAELRIARGIWILGIAGMVVCWVGGGWRWGAGFALGALLSALNFHWMKAAVDLVAEAASSPSAPGDGAGKPRGSKRVRVGARFVLRYALIGVAAYVIFTTSVFSLAAFFLGLFLFLAAILAEIAYQVYAAFRNP